MIGREPTVMDKKAETFDQFFSAMFIAKNQDIPEVDFRVQGECLTDIHISEEEVRKRLETSGYYKVPWT